MKILVTGGTGFTGKALVRRLIEDGHDLVVLDYKEGLKIDEIRDWGATVVLGSVTDPEIVARCMEGVEVVHHLAAAFRELDVSDQHYREVNVDGTRIMLEAALRHGVRKFVYCSTCGVHGHIEDPPGSEDAPIEPADYYQRTKYEAELLVDAFFERGLKTVTLRLAGNYGPGDPGRFLMLFRQAVKGYFPMFGNGKTLFHPGYIDNLLDAFVLSMADGKGDGRAYLIADEQYFELNELVRRVGHAVGLELRIHHLPIAPLVAAGHVCEKLCKPFKIAPPIFPRRVDWFRQDRAFKIERAKRDLGYRPQIGIDEGLRRTAEWYWQEGMLAVPKPSSRRVGTPRSADD